MQVYIPYMEQMGAVIFGGLRPMGFLPKHSNMTLVFPPNVKKYR